MGNIVEATFVSDILPEMLIAAMFALGHHPLSNPIGVWCGLQFCKNLRILKGNMVYTLNILSGMVYTLSIWSPLEDWVNL